MKKVIVLFGHKAVIKAAKSVGMFVINILTTDLLHSTFLKASKLADRTVVIGSLDQLESTVYGLIQTEEIFGVVSFTDTREGVKNAAIFSEKYLTRNRFVPSRSVELLFYKNEARAYFMKLKQPYVAFTVPTREEDIEAFILENGASIMKPISGQASEDIILLDSCSCVGSLTAEQRALLSNGGYILEKFIEGPEFSVESITTNGRTIILGITRKRKIPSSLPHCEFVEMGHTFPTTISKEVDDKICNVITALFDSLDVTTALGHTEVIINDGMPYIVESHLRAGGDCIPELVEKVTGYSPYKLFFMGMLDIELPCLENHGFAGIEYYIPKQIGTIEQVHFEADGHDYSGEIKDRLDFSEKIVTPISSSFGRKWGYAIACSDSPEETLSRYLGQYKISYHHGTQG